MTGLAPLGYAAVFVGALVLTLVLVPLALRAALRLGVLDHPGGHKLQDGPVPYLGGAAIVLAFVVAVMTAALVRRPDGGLAELGVVLAAAVGVSLLGLLDDLRGLGPAPRLAAVAAAGLVLAGVGVRVDLPFGTAVDVVVTVLWVVAITNAFNLLDNMDGLSAGVAAVGAACLSLLAALHGQFLVAALAAALAGCALGFLRHNRYPARIYMGDAGSLFLGFMLAVLAIKLTVPTSPVISSFVVLLALAVAIFDTTLVCVGRLAHGRSPFTGGRDHVSHRLVALGLPVPVAVTVIHGGAIALAWLAVVMSRLQDLGTAHLLLGFVVVSLLLLGVWLGRVPVYGESPDDVSAAGARAAGHGSTPPRRGDHGET